MTLPFISTEYTLVYFMGHNSLHFRGRNDALTIVNGYFWCNLILWSKERYKNPKPVLLPVIKWHFPNFNREFGTKSGRKHMYTSSRPAVLYKESNASKTVALQPAFHLKGRWIIINPSASVHSRHANDRKELQGTPAYIKGGATKPAQVVLGWNKRSHEEGKDSFLRQGGQQGCAFTKICPERVHK